MDTNISVLIVGGGLNGLTAACLLSHHGVRCVLVERHTDTSIQYKFAGISPRSMEIFRSLGLEDEIRANRTGDQQGGGIARGKNLADPDLQWSGAAWPDASPVSPTQPATCDQNILEPILRRRAEQSGADIRFGTECLAIEEDAQEVCARVRNVETGEEYTIYADYFIAADGANGRSRDMLGIGRSGAGVLQNWMNIIFETDMPPTIDGRRFTSCFVTDINAAIIPRGDGRWLLSLQYLPEKGERPEDFDAARCRDLVVRAAGRSDITAELVDARPWEVAAHVADRFSKGRSFLVGDAAHLMPPPGAFGGNSGIHDAHNLAWKLAMVILGKASPSILETYDTERRPVIEATVAQALARLRQWFDDPAKRLPPPVDIVDDYDVVFGQRYDRGAVLPEGPVPKMPPFEPFETLSGKPGTRAPHLKLRYEGQEISTLDLFGGGFVLLAGAQGDAWCRAAADAGLDLTCYRMGRDLTDIEGKWTERYGARDTGAVLVRPDGFVAWRTEGAGEAAEVALADAWTRVLTSPGLQGA
ncbi:FAD-dependent monooxygenase [Nitratireductor sp. ZSWI3]|uniref:FAD-dependent monooxygenase n=1 Tax=Nitratireductor sp. ZSWI3 TaxID=2966359 RepID=UPI002150045F|nr:FAD-dependent monooxygenase [Nitratireductor sp. ZSWI3]MCR4265947.1 FAD-dependent monooxygenase [Nitratireductor sp. ZSWI3]